MNSVIRKVLPASMIDLARTVLREGSHRSSTAFSRYAGGGDAVLPCSIAYNRFGGYCVPLSSRHRPANRKIVAGEVWEPQTIDFMTRHCTGGDIVHAGTYFGDFIPALSKACDAGAKIWAFEPNPENYRCASITVMLNGLHNVELANAGLGAQPGFLSMKVADASGRALGGASQLIEAGNLNGRERLATVEILKVDDAVPSDRNVSILQLDVEGFEQPALSGALETIRRCKPILILEAQPETDWFAENILQLGYRVSGKVHDNTILAVG